MLQHFANSIWNIVLKHIPQRTMITAFCKIIYMIPICARIHRICARIQNISNFYKDQNNNMIIKSKWWRPGNTLVTLWNWNGHVYQWCHCKQVNPSTYFVKKLSKIPTIPNLCQVSEAMAWKRRGKRLPKNCKGLKEAGLHPCFHTVNDGKWKQGCNYCT